MGLLEGRRNSVEKFCWAAIAAAAAVGCPAPAHAQSDDLRVQSARSPFTERGNTDKRREGRWATDH
jgi:hypothetical protein